MDVNFEETLKYKDHLFKYVRVNAKNERYEGWMKALDPLSGNIILVTLDAKKSKVIASVLIMGQAYKSIDILESDDDISNLIKNVSLASNLPQMEVSKVKEQLIDWIKKHRIPIKENADGSLEVCESVTIKSPYRPEDCICLNSRILSKVTDMIRNMPLGNVEESGENETEEDF